MDKLREVVQKYGHWSGLLIYVDRIEAYVQADFSLSIENAKALLETIGKEICEKNGYGLEATTSVNSVLKKAFASLGYSNATFVSQISSALATIGQRIGELRNEIGLTSHGKTLEEIEGRNDKVDLLTREFLIGSVELLSVFLIRTFEVKSKRDSTGSLVETLRYLDAEEFNEFWDDSFGEFAMGEYSYTASEILFSVDKEAYVDEYKAFIENEGR